MNKVTVLSVGGSIVAPDKVDIEFIEAFKALAIETLNQDPERKLILIIGGGGPARHYQQAFRSISKASNPEQEDWIGIMATRLNAELIKGVFGDLCPLPVVTDPTVVGDFQGRVMVAAGWKPGFSTDNDAVLLAEKFAADTVINLSNIKKVYSDDPKLNPDAVPLDSISWEDYLAMVGKEWTPGKNCPFDPVASHKAAELGLRVITAGGKDLANTARILAHEAFEGTIIE